MNHWTCARFGEYEFEFRVSANIMKFFLFNDPAGNYATYYLSDCDKDSELAASVLSAVDPNLQPFASRGGK